jgi:hypothetical protein
MCDVLHSPRRAQGAVPGVGAQPSPESPGVLMDRHGPATLIRAASARKFEKGHQEGLEDLSEDENDNGFHLILVRGGGGVSISCERGINNDFHFHQLVVRVFLLLAVIAAQPAIAADEPVADGDEVVVTATRTPGRLGDSPVAVEVIGREELEGSGADTLAEVLEHQPGLQVTRTFRGSALRMNGLDSDCVLVLIDGQPVQGRVGGAIDLSRFPVDRIERVEVVRGAASALYGADAIGGVVHIITRKGELGIGVVARLSGGALAGSDTEAALTRFPGALPLTWTPGGEPNTTVDSSVSASAGGKRWSSWSLASLQSTPALTRPGEQATVFDGQTTTTVSERVDLEVSEDHRWTAQAAYTLRQSAALEETDAGALIDRAASTEFVEAAIGPDLLFGSRGRLTSSLAWSAFRDQSFVDQRAATALDTYEETWDHATELDVVGTVLPSDRHAATGGVELRHEVLRTDRLERVAVGGFFAPVRPLLRPRGPAHRPPEHDCGPDRRSGHREQLRPVQLRQHRPGLDPKRGRHRRLEGARAAGARGPRWVAADPRRLSRPAAVGATAGHGWTRHPRLLPGRPVPAGHDLLLASARHVLRRP